MTHIVDCASIYLTMLNDMVNLWRPHNRRLAKKRPYWFSGVFCFAFCLSWADVFTLRNPLIRQAP